LRVARDRRPRQEQPYSFTTRLALEPWRLPGMTRFTLPATLVGLALGAAAFAMPAQR
jgi:hypothetical protein